MRTFAWEYGVLCLCWLSAACSSGSAVREDDAVSPEAPETSNSGSPAPTPGTPTEPTEGTAGSGALPSGGAVAGASAVHRVGRFVVDGEQLRFAWSGSGVLARFSGTSVGVTLQDGGSNQFAVVVDGELRETLVASSGSQRYELAAGLPAGEHRVELYRRTEASFGATTFQGFDFGVDGAVLAAPEPATRKLEIIGDSISCGYGNEGPDTSCGFSADTENHYATYGAIAARALDAEVVTIAWSGKGIVYNYDTDTTDPLPALYDRVLPSDPSSTWDFSVQPEAVVINLGTNDFSTEDDPTPELFSGRYLELLEHLREVYPTAYILCTVGPLLGGADLDAARAGIDAAVQGMADDRIASMELNVPNDDPGCDWHPSLATHQAMADVLVGELSARLGW